MARGMDRQRHAYAFTACRAARTCVTMDIKYMEDAH